jgi:flavin reductase (DIM6/NTAB) family NADH-FMN oxidoreductase RutF
MKIAPENLNKRDAHHLLMSAVVPRPIAFVSTIGEDGVFNVAPFSGFAVIATIPALVCLQISLKRDGQKKDTLKNIEFSKDFVVNVVNESLAEAMNKASAEYPSNVDEFKEVGLTAAKSDLVKAPRVAESPVNMECKYLQTLEFGESLNRSYVIIGKVVLVHVKDELWTGDHIDISKLKPVGRLGGDYYCQIKDKFEMKRQFKM